MKDDLIFVSEKPYSEVEKEFANVDFFSGIMDGLEEALAYEQGKAKAETFVRKRNLPEIDVAEERKKLKMSQRTFAKVLGVSPRTVEAWESGRTNPSPTAKNLLYLISEDHSLVEKLTDR